MTDSIFTAYLIVESPSHDLGGSDFLWSRNRDVAEQIFAESVRNGVDQDGCSTVEMFSMKVDAAAALGSKFGFVTIDELSERANALETVDDLDPLTAYMKRHYTHEDQAVERLRVRVPESADWSYVWPLLSKGQVNAELGGVMGPVDEDGFVHISTWCDLNEIARSTPDELHRKVLGSDAPDDTKPVSTSLLLYSNSSGAREVHFEYTTHVSGIWSGWTKGLLRSQVLGF